MSPQCRCIWIVGPANRPFVFKSNLELNWALRFEIAEMCGTADSSFQSSNTLNNTGIWSLIELVSLYTVPLSTVNGLSRLTTTSNGQAWPIRKFLNPLIAFEWNRIGTADSNLNRISKLSGSLMNCIIIIIVHCRVHWSLTLKTADMMPAVLLATRDRHRTARDKEHHQVLRAHAAARKSVHRNLPKMAASPRSVFTGFLMLSLQCCPCPCPCP